MHDDHSSNVMEKVDSTTKNNENKNQVNYSTFCKQLKVRRTLPEHKVQLARRIAKFWSMRDDSEGIEKGGIFCIRGGEQSNHIPSSSSSSSSSFIVPSNRRGRMKNTLPQTTQFISSSQTYETSMFDEPTDSWAMLRGKKKFFILW